MATSPDKAQLQAAVNAARAAMQAGRPAEAAERLQRLIAGLPEIFPGRARLQNELLLACRAALEQETAQERVQDPAAGRAWLDTALGLPVPSPATDPEAARIYGEAFSWLGQHLFGLSRFDEALACHRRSVRVSRNPIYQIHLSNALTCTREPARLTDFADGLSPSELGRKLLIACVPKSGSSFLNNVLQRLTGWGEVPAYAPSGQFEQELYLPTLVRYARTPAVIQQHCRATDANLQILQAFDIRPVVLVRNFEDALWSLVEFYRSGASFQTVFHPDFPALDPDAQVELLIAHRMPWYFEFVATWQRVQREARLPLFWLSYEELMADKAGSAQRLSAFWGLDVPDVRVQEVVEQADGDRARNRFNVGRSGRGRENLSEAQRQQLWDHARYFPSADFRAVGLDSDGP